MSRLLATLMKLLSRVLRNRALTIRHGPARGLRRRFGQGFKPKFGDTAEERYVEALELAGKTVFDVGAYIGIMTLFFARAVGAEGRVISFEPNPENHRELSGNIALNGFEHVTLLQLGIGEAPGQAELALDPVYPSRGSLLPSEGGVRVPITVESLDNLAATGVVPPPDFVKIDVEGLEDQVLAGMARMLSESRPELFIELHGQASHALLRQLLGAGYRLHHVETGADWTCDEPPQTRGGHLHCR